MVTHETGFARQVADKVLFMDGGVVVESGSPSTVLDNPNMSTPKRSSSMSCRRTRPRLFSVPLELGEGREQRVPASTQSSV